jgi:peptide/nickel transport system substrate-binding protein
MTLHSIRPLLGFVRWRVPLVQHAGILVMALLFACAPAQPPTTAPPPGAVPDRQPQAAQGAVPTEWVVGIADEAPSLDPGLSPSIASASTAQLHIFDTLASFVGQSPRLESKLAESWKMIDERTWEFALRRGVKFHNGDDFTAKDVVYSMGVYRNERSPKKVYTEQIADVEQVDPYTVRIRTRDPNPTLFTSIAEFPILPSEARERIGEDVFAREPVGTGPYRVVEFARGERLVLEANPTYWRGAPQPAKLTLRPIADPSTRVSELKTGGVQIIAGPPAARLKELDEGDTELLRLKGGRTIMYPFITKAKPFDDVRVRQAANYAVNREAVVKNILEGYGELLHGPFASSWLGYDPTLQPYPYDPAKAKQLLAEAGYPNGVDTVFDVSNGVFLRDREIAEAVAAQLAEVGIRVQLVPTERAKLITDWLSGVGQGITSAQWGAAADPDPLLSWTFYKRPAHKPDEQLNSLIEQTQRTVDPEERKRLLQQFGHYVQDQAYWLFIHAQDEFYARRKGIPWEPTPDGQSYSNMRFYYTPAR